MDERISGLPSRGHFSGYGKDNIRGWYADFQATGTEGRFDCQVQSRVSVVSEPGEEAEVARTALMMS